jgi:hypothetical protein
VVTYGDRALIIVPWSNALRDRTGLELIPLPDGRALIAFDDRLSAPELELRLGDALADPKLIGDDRTTFHALAEILGDARRGAESVVLRNIIVLHLAKPAVQSADDSGLQPISA